MQVYACAICVSVYIFACAWLAVAYVFVGACMCLWVSYAPRGFMPEHQTLSSARDRLEAAALLYSINPFKH